ncbi:U4/U6 small nuclear ribonucleoprotein Prp4 [Cichlidogyrus casuarinus]|uniref:U4/U6 small nuclear ribonucleoprotein Prp4 n=1 Tax=Cichlidogyrus casuarinus TaxID=1844966 RepID=A0ABD2Q344_9PLAT
MHGSQAEEQLYISLVLPELFSKFPMCLDPKKSVKMENSADLCSHLEFNACLSITAPSNIFENLKQGPACPAEFIQENAINHYIHWHHMNVLNKYICGSDTSTLHINLPDDNSKPLKMNPSEQFRIAKNLFILSAFIGNFAIILLGLSLLVLNPIAKTHSNPASCVTSADEAAMRAMELRKKARTIQVSTEDVEIKAYLRQLNEPICIFGEDPANRRDRLRLLLAVTGGPAQRPSLEEQSRAQESSSARNENIVWYHEGTETLRKARMMIAEYSIARASDRLKKARAYYAEKTEAQRKAHMQEQHKQQQTVGLSCSQVGDSRPIVYCNFSPEGTHLATASWSGLCKIWSVPDCELQATLRGHAQNASCVRWHPRAFIDQTKQSINLASCAHDGSVKLWSLDSEEPLADIEGHAPHRVSRLAFHPSGRFLGTTCHDKSWRFWDLEACEEILHQEGHSKPVYDISFHPDGSLALTGSLDSYGRVWDLRTGRCIMFLAGHLEDCVGVEMASNGWHALTCSVDNTVRIWDLRQQQTIYVIPAHAGVCSSARFDREYLWLQLTFSSANRCDFIVTTSFDGTAKIWGHPVWAQLKLLDAHSGKVAFSDISPDGKSIATCSHDLTFKLWNQGIDT